MCDLRDFETRETSLVVGMSSFVETCCKNWENVAGRKPNEVGWWSSEIMSANGASWAVSLEAPEYIPLVLCSCVLSSVWSRGAQNFHSRGKGALYALW